MISGFPIFALSRLRRQMAEVAALSVIALLSLQGAFATVTIELCIENGDLQNGSVGILVADVNGDGFLSPSDPAALGTILEVGQTIGTSDDVIIAICSADTGAHWDGSAGFLTTLAAIDYDSLGVSSNDDLILYAFPEITQAGTRLQLGDAVHTYRSPVTGNSGGTIPFEAPDDPGVYTLAALSSGLGGDFNPDTPVNGEEVSEGRAGMPGASGGGDVDGDSRSNPTQLTSGQSSSGSLSPNDLDYYSVPVSGLSRITAFTTGGVDTVGYLYAPDGSSANSPDDDDNAGSGNNFRSVSLIDQNGIATLAIRGKDDNQSGDYEVTITVEQVPEYRTDLTIGTTAGAPLGNGVYNSSGAGQSITTKLKKPKSHYTYFKGQNDGGLLDQIRFAGTKGNRNFRVTYLRLSAPGGNVTASITAGRYFAELGTGEEALFRVQTKGTSSVKKKGRGTMNLSILASSSSGGGADLGRSKIIVKAKKKKKKR